MCMTSALLDVITNSPPEQAWEAIRHYLWSTFSAPLPEGKNADAEIVNRDRSINELENVLSSSCWDQKSFIHSGISMDRAKRLSVTIVHRSFHHQSSQRRR